MLTESQIQIGTRVKLSKDTVHVKGIFFYIVGNSEDEDEGINWDESWIWLYPHNSSQEYGFFTLKEDVLRHGCLYEEKDVPLEHIFEVIELEVLNKTDKFEGQ